MKAFLKSAFSESDGTASFARIQTFVQSSFVLWWVSHTLLASGHIPDLPTLGGLASFATGPYTVNKVSTMFGGKE